MKPGGLLYWEGNDMKIRSVYPWIIALMVLTMPVLGQEHDSTNDIVSKMKVDLNLSDSQVAGITQVIDRYVDSSDELQRSIDDGTMNQSAIDSQRQQIKALEDQGLAQYLRSDQLAEWNNIQAQTDQQKDKDTGSADADAGSSEYSNLPRNNSP